jgi:HSP20 family protein
MKLVRFTPDHDLLGLHDDVARLIQGNFPLRPNGNGATWLPPVDVHETPSGFTLTMDVPGINPADIKVRIVDGTLTLEGERKIEHGDDDAKTTHRSERLAGSFSRSFTLRTPVNAAAIRAVYKDGVLEVTLPRAEEAMPREIKVEIE